MGALEKRVKNIEEINRIILWFMMGSIILVFGGLLNVAAIASNGGKMPVYTNLDYNSSTHFTFQDKNEVNKFFLTDIIKIGGVYHSLGDFFIYVGIVFLFFLLLQSFITKSRNRKKNKSQLNHRR